MKKEQKFFINGALIDKTYNFIKIFQEHNSVKSDIKV